MENKVEKDGEGGTQEEREREEEEGGERGRGREMEREGVGVLSCILRTRSQDKEHMKIWGSHWEREQKKTWVRILQRNSTKWILSIF